MGEDDKQPECTDCGDPATTQIYAGSVNRGGAWSRTYVWLCDHCARVSEQEREWRRRG